MKLNPLFLLLLTFFLWQPAWGQQEKSIYVGLRNQLDLKQLTVKWNVAPLLGYKADRHQLATGPVMVLRTLSPANEQRPLLTGMLFHYRYGLSPVKKKIVWHTSFTIELQRLQENWHSNYWDASSHSYRDAVQESRELVWENYAGIGLAYPLQKRLTIAATAEVGYAFSRMRRMGQSPEEPDNHFDYRNYDSGEFVYGFSLDLSVKLGQWY